MSKKCDVFVGVNRVVFFFLVGRFQETSGVASAHQRPCIHLAVIHVRALIIIRVNPTNALMFVIFLHAICRYPNMLRSILIIFRELFNVKKAYTGVPGGMCQTSGGCSLC